MKSKNPQKTKHANLYLFLFALLITIIIYKSIDIANELLPEDKKYSAEIWGTVNDWIIYGVMLVTAVFLYQTLQSQMKVQKMQQKLMDIEDFKFRRELMPRFDIQGDPPEYKKNHILTKYNVIVRDNDAQNISIECNSKSSIHSGKKTWNKKILDKNNTMDFHYEIPIEAGSISFEIRIYVNFEDIKGNRYSQYAEIIKPDKRTQSYGQRPRPTPLTEEV
ncbi:hypothetical protein [Sinomicrobium sp. M5D2P17]